MYVQPGHLQRVIAWYTKYTLICDADRYKFKDEETLRLVLRTHTTAVSTWALHRLAEDPRPARYFSIDRVFRNETVDATHLAEFHQIEGVIADFGLTLGGSYSYSYICV